MDKSSPKELLNESAKKVVYKTKIGLKNQLGHLETVEVNGEVYAPKRYYGSKREAQQNSALFALHVIECGTKK